MSDLKITVRGQEFPVEIQVSGDQKRATFVADFHGRFIRAAEWAALYSALMTETRKAQTKIAVRFFDVDRLDHGTIYSIHASSGNPMVEWDDGGKEQLGTLYGGDRIRPLDEAEAKEIARLKMAEREAQAALRNFTKARSLNLRQEIQAALAED